MRKPLEEWAFCGVCPQLSDILKVEVPVDAIARANTVTIRNAGPYVEHQGRPMFHYMVIRK